MIINSDHKDQENSEHDKNDDHCDQDDDQDHDEGDQVGEDGHLHSSGNQGGLTGNPCLLGK